MRASERRITTWSEYLLYCLLLVQPLTGWVMLSAARFPITLLGPVALPGIAPRNVDVFAALRECHGAFALVLFLAFTAYMTAVLFHTLVSWRCGAPSRRGAAGLTLRPKPQSDDLSARARSGRI